MTVKKTDITQLNLPDLCAHMNSIWNVICCNYVATKNTRTKVILEADMEILREFDELMKEFSRRMTQ